MAIKSKLGQTLIETALILSILLILILGITEFSRAWFLKNTLKNAVRQGVRKAVVTSPITQALDEGCPGTNVIVRAVCMSAGMNQIPEARVSVMFDGSEAPKAGDTVTVKARYDFKFVVGGGSLWPWPGFANLAADASMRYELQ